MTALDREGKTIGFVVSPRATNEEIFMLKEIAGRLKKVALRHLRLLPHGQGPGGIPPHGPLLPLRVRPAPRCRPDHRRGGQPALEQPSAGRQGAGCLQAAGQPDHGGRPCADGAHPPSRMRTFRSSRGATPPSSTPSRGPSGASNEKVGFDAACERCGIAAGRRSGAQPRLSARRPISRSSSAPGYPRAARA